MGNSTPIELSWLKKEYPDYKILSRNLERELLILRNGSYLGKVYDLKNDYLKSVYGGEGELKDILSRKEAAMETIKTPHLTRHGDDHYIFIMRRETDRMSLMKYMENNNNSFVNDQDVCKILFQILKQLSAIHETHFHYKIDPDHILIKSEPLSVILSDVGLGYPRLKNSKEKIDIKYFDRHYRYQDIGYLDNKDGNKYDIGCDIFSVGIIACDIIFGLNKISTEDLHCQHNIEIIREELERINKLEYFELFKVFFSNDRKSRSCAKLLKLDIFRELLQWNDKY